MSKFLHRDAVGRETDGERLGIVWPPLPWTCPGCKRVWPTHEATVATVDLPWTPENVAKARFYCVPCDFMGHTLEHESGKRGEFS